MDLVVLFKAVILGIVEGLTEFLPISSTGHLILAGDLLHFNDERGKAFEIIIQAGAILAVCWEYRVRLLHVAERLGRPDANRFVFNLFVAFVPAAVLGLLFAHKIKQYLFSPIPVASAFILGAFVILWAEKRQHTVRVNRVEDMRWHDALMVGFAQTLALIPGTSRSGSTIIGGMLLGLSRQAATEFSFFLAIPTLFAATGYEIYKNRSLFIHSHGNMLVFAVGFVTAFISALFAVRALLRYISHHDFTVFAWYRIVFGFVVLATAWSGLVDWSVG
jgi:undecaprenyl-diphosphatase